METSIATKQKINSYFPALTGLRAVAASLVFAHHFMPKMPFASCFFRMMFQEGHMGVTIFFVLSGFLIAFRYSQTFETNQYKVFRSYALHRFARIYPIYFLSTIVALIFLKDFRISSWIINMLVGQGLFSEFMFTGIGVGWSMTVEVVFYFLVPWVLIYWNRIGLMRWLLITYLIGLILLWVGQWPMYFDFIPDLNFLIRDTFFGRCFEFYLGIWLAKKFSFPFVRTWNMIFSRGFLTYAGALGILLSMFWMAYIRGVPPEVLRTLQLVAFNTINNYVLPLFIGALIVGLVREDTIISKLLGSKLVVELGKGSFIFYLIHATFGFEVVYFHVSKNIFIIYLLLNLISVAGFALFEEPMRKYIVRTFAGRGARQNC